MLEVNIPAVVDELTGAFQIYERALIGNDIEALNRLFWDSEQTLRYGPRESLHGHTEIADFRRGRGPIDQRRTLLNTQIVTFGHAFGVANTEFIALANGRTGRQSQTWLRTEAGWRIVSAHVSFVETE